MPLFARLLVLCLLLLAVGGGGVLIALWRTFLLCAGDLAERERNGWRWHSGLCRRRVGHRALAHGAPPLHNNRFLARLPFVVAHSLNHWLFAESLGNTLFPQVIPFCGHFGWSSTTTTTKNNTTNNNCTFFALFLCLCLFLCCCLCRLVFVGVDDVIFLFVV